METEVRWGEALVTDTTGDLPSMRYVQGMIAGLREAGREIDDMRKRYNEDDDGNDSELGR
jgi:hypothetical protein